LNILLDVSLCIYPFHFGVKGAAIATALSNAASSLILLSAVYKRNFKTEIGGSLRERVSRFAAMLKVPSTKDFLELIQFAGAIFGIIIGKLVCYSALTLSATRFGVTSLAAHNVLLRIFFFFGTFGDSLSQSVQNFLPTVYTANPRNPTSPSFVKFEKFHAQLGMGCAVVFSALALGFTGSKTMASAFTTDSTILSILSKSSPALALSLIFHPIVLLLEGSIIAKRDTNFLLGSYAATFGVLWVMMKKAVDLKNVWEGFVVFQGFRLLQYAGRYMWQRGKDVELNGSS
ncbi:hypothetical protein TL16_g04240, partial [Triparma laevis f. inornata]